MTSRRAELAELRDRAVTDAHTIRSLRAQLAAAGARAAAETARLDAQRATSAQLLADLDEARSAITQIIPLVTRFHDTTACISPTTCHIAAWLGRASAITKETRP